MALLLAAGIFIVFMLLYIYYKSSREPTSRIPGPKGYPIIGSALQMKPRKMHSQFYDFACKYGPIFEVQAFSSRLVSLNSVEMINNAFYRDGTVFNDRPGSFYADYQKLNQSIAFRNSDKVFNVSKKSFSKGIRTFENGIHAIKGEIARVMEQIDGFGEHEFEVVSLINRSLINVISLLLIGEEARNQDANNFLEFTILSERVFLNPITNALLTYLPILLNIPYYKRAMKRINGLREQLNERYFYQSKDTNSQEEVRGLIDFLLHDRQESSEAESILTDERIKAIFLVDVFSGGVTTTSTVLPSIILCLAHNPKCQTKLQEEIDRVIGDERQPTITDKTDCPFVEAVIMETMRYITPVPFLLPHECSKDTEFEGFLVKKGVMILPNVWFILHDENIWGDPWTFRPERFLDENGKLLPNSHPYMKSWLPFGVGRRKCPGMGMATTRIFLYLTSLFQKWTFITSPGKCGSCDPRSDDFVFDVLFKPKPFHCIAKIRT